jgi:hypothetical protein
MYQQAKRKYGLFRPIAFDEEKQEPKDQRKIGEDKDEGGIPRHLLPAEIQYKQEADNGCR